MKVNKGKSICVFGGKGGTGKTTLTLILAGMFANLNKRVLLIDFDLTGGAIALHLNKENTKTVYNLVDDYNNHRFTNLKNYVTTYNNQIDYISAPKDPRQAGKIDNRYIEIILEKAVFLYDIVLVDTNHFLNATNLCILDQVDKIIFNLTNDPYDLKNLRSIISIFNDLNIKKYKVLLNMSTTQHKHYYSKYDIKNIIKSNIDYTLPNKLFLKNIDDYVINSEIISLNKDFATKQKEAYTTLKVICDDILRESV